MLMGFPCPPKKKKSLRKKELGNGEIYKMLKI
jgi:hypothetical protein